MANESRKALQTLLMSSRLSRNSDVEEREGSKPVFKYNAAIEIIQRKEEFVFAFVGLKVEKLIEENAVVEFSCLYMIGYQGDPFESEDEEYGYLDNLIEVSAWPRFRDLFEVTGSQAELDFPRLPNAPGEISRPRVKKD